MAIINPTPIYQKPNVQEEFFVFTGYVRSVTDRGKYNSLSFKINSEDGGIDAPLISVRCFEQTVGVNHKKLVENAKGRFVTVLAVKNVFKGKTDYIARYICIAPREFSEASHPIIDEAPMVDNVPEKVIESEVEYEQLTFDFDNTDNDELPF